MFLTDLVFSNPNGREGAIVLTRDGDPLYELRLENFRDLDFHFITPLTFQKNDRMDLSCVQPDKSSCDASVYYSGYFKNPPQ